MNSNLGAFCWTLSTPSRFFFFKLPSHFPLCGLVLHCILMCVMSVVQNYSIVKMCHTYWTTYIIPSSPVSPSRRVNHGFLVSLRSSEFNVFTGSGYFKRGRNSNETSEKRFLIKYHLKFILVTFFDETVCRTRMMCSRNTWKMKLFLFLFPTAFYFDKGCFKTTCSSIPPAVVWGSEGVTL